MSDRMPIITLYPPWANWVTLGWKTIETRTHTRFRSLVGKRIGIHAALTWDLNAIPQASAFLDEYRLRESEQFLRVGGAIICTALAEAHRELDPLDSAAALIDCTHIRRYGLFLKDIQLIECIPCRGHQGIWYHDIPVVTA